MSQQRFFDRRFFIEGAHEAGDVVTFGRDDAHKIVDVLRMRDGDSIVVVDSTARAYRASIRLSGGAAAHLDEVIESAPASRVSIVLAQAIPKGQKFDFVVEKATELGVVRILPVQSSRAIAGASANKLERWRKLARTAAAQCGRTTIPAVDEPIAFEDLTRTIATFDVAFLAWELATEPLRETLARHRAARSVLAIVGPEGGFSHAEAEAAVGAGAHPVSLGRRILRTETAPLVLLTALLYESGEL